MWEEIFRKEGMFESDFDFGFVSMDAAEVPVGLTTSASSERRTAMEFFFASLLYEYRYVFRIIEFLLEHCDAFNDVVKIPQVPVPTDRSVQQLIRHSDTG